MAFSLSNWFKGKPGAPGGEHSEEPPAVEASAPAAPAAPSAPAATAVRTVMPNSVQPVSLRTPGSPGARPGPVQLPVSSPSPAQAPAARVSTVIPAARGKIAFGNGPGAPAADAPAAASISAPRNCTRT